MFIVMFTDMFNKNSLTKKEEPSFQVLSRVGVLSIKFKLKTGAQEVLGAPLSVLEC